jgi:hypothetical protein
MRQGPDSELSGCHNSALQIIRGQTSAHWPAILTEFFVFSSVFQEKDDRDSTLKLALTTSFYIVTKSFINRRIIWRYTLWATNSAI